ncbi:MAG: hypothetical protein F6J93_14855 [Oscillatoria sp. SIO1A7]|nr:hypothetical protein [Oscillatoria sp. SIO1A7]
MHYLDAHIGAIARIGIGGQNATGAIENRMIKIKMRLKEFRIRSLGGACR